MSAKFYTLLTEIGAAKLASSAALGVPLKITQMAVGDGGGVLPSPSAQQTTLVAEKRRSDLNMLYVDPQNSSQIIAEQVIPETEGGWWIREVGLFDEDGALIAVGNCPESYKPQLAEGSGRTQTVRMVLITSSTDNITLKIDPTVVLATRQYVDDVVLELKVYVDDQMVKHVADADPHTQYAPKESPVLTGTPKVPTAPSGTNTTQIASTAFVQAVVSALNNALALKAPRASPVLTGTPKVPTAPSGTNTTQIASTAFVQAVVSALNNALALKAPRASPVLTGTPKAPTAAQSVNNTQIATTAFVKSAIAALVSSSPAALDTLNELAAALGNDPNFATTVMNALAGKQPLNSTLTDLSGRSVAGILEYLGLLETISQAANAIPKTRTVNRHSLESDLALTADDVSAFALGQTGGRVVNEDAVPWNASSGVYDATLPGSSCLILHFNMGVGSCPAVQFKVNYRNGGVYYRSARDGYGFESDWVELMPATKTVQDIRLSTREGSQIWRGSGYSDQPPYVITGVENGNRDDVPDQAYRRALQKLINGTWYNVGGL
ncbi:phage tail protein [Edwardsiella piscicida]|uniref:phage tail protein n=1 Tax=Edwardsiella piscicida TaxID=1263550 RepID=UPI00370DD3AC